MGYWILQETLIDNGEPEHYPVRWIEELPPSDIQQSRLVNKYLNGGIEFSLTLLAGPFPNAAEAVAWLVEYERRKS